MMSCATAITISWKDWLSIFASGIKNQRFKKIAEPYFLAAALDSVIDASLLLWLDAPERYPYPEDPDTILNIFFQRTD